MICPVTNRECRTNGCGEKCYKRDSLGHNTIAKNPIHKKIDQHQVTLSDEELVEKCTEWISKLCATGGRAWSLEVPVNFNRDPDILFSELIQRFKRMSPHINELPDGEIAISS